MAVYPGSIATDANLLVAADNIQTKLTSGMLVGDTVAIVATTTGWAANMVATVESEQMLVTSVSGANVLNVTRGQYGTSAAAHVAGKTVSNFVDAVYHNNLKGEVIAIETTLGANMANVPGSPSGGIVPVAKGGTGVSSAQGVGGSKVQLAAGTTTTGHVPVYDANGALIDFPVQGAGGTKVQLAAGTTTTGNVPKYDANGALVDSGVLPSVSPTGTAAFQRYRSNGVTPFAGAFTSPPAAFQPDFDFAAQTPGGTLTGGGGLQSITLTPCPVGIIANGPYASTVYISNGTGTAEACVCAGGTATSGLASGTILVSPLNSHSGAWTVTSATGGLQEAINYQWLTYVGGTVWLNPQAGITLHGRVSFPTGGFSLDGLGGATATISRASDYPNGDLLYLNPSSSYYTNISNLRIDNQTTASQTSGAAINCTLNRCVLTNFYCSGGYIQLYLDAAPGFRGQGIELHTGTHSNSLIKLSSVVGLSVPTDVVFSDCELFVNLGVGVRIGACDGATFSNFQGGNGSPGWLVSPEAAPGYVANLKIDGLLWDSNGNNGNAVIDIAAGASSAGNVTINNCNFLDGSTYGVVVAGAATPVSIVGCWFGRMDNTAIQQNGAASYPMLISGCTFIDSDYGSHANTPQILCNGGNMAVTANAFYGDRATWHIGSEGATSNLLITGNDFKGSAAPFSLDMGFGTVPTNCVISGNLGVDNVIGTVADAATIVFPANPNFVISGSGTTITQATMTQVPKGMSGTLRTTGGAIAFTATGVIGSAGTTVQNKLYSWQWDGTKLWVYGSGF